MWCGVITLFGQMFHAIKDHGITGRAIKNGLLTLETWDPRDYTTDKYATVDDRPYGGGPGMVMLAQPLREALAQAKFASPGLARVVYVTPGGERFDHAKARKLAQSAQPLIFVAGRYEGIDYRVIEQDIDEQLSIGDYVLSGGELAVMVMIDAITRWIPGALGHELSAVNDTFSEEMAGLLDCPHYTRPACIGTQKVPEVLLTGDHQAIARWRKKQSLGQTWLHRSDILEKLTLDETSQALLAEFQLEYEKN
ncbi:MAG: tRNA (guanosine(37)-N1)-methyltransferase TrmD [Proteobacteria bacterium]|nr:tRNA (guanosine(37)-N1)-methyltransferase TrmD [Pseudomonadota bacterium]